MRGGREQNGPSAVLANQGAIIYHRNPPTIEALIIPKASRDGWLKWWRISPGGPAIKVRHTVASTSSVIDQMWSVIPAAIAGVTLRVL